MLTYQRIFRQVIHLLCIIIIIHVPSIPQDVPIPRINYRCVIRRFPCLSFTVLIILLRSKSFLVSLARTERESLVSITVSRSTSFSPPSHRAREGYLPIPCLPPAFRAARVLLNRHLSSVTSTDGSLVTGAIFRGLLTGDFLGASLKWIGGARGCRRRRGPVWLLLRHREVLPRAASPCVS